MVYATPETDRYKNTVILLEGDLSFIEESGELRQTGETVARIGHDARKAFITLIKNPDIAISFVSIYTSVGLNPPEFIDYGERKLIGSWVGTIRERLNTASDGLGTRLEAIPGFGYRWRSTRPEPTK